MRHRGIETFQHTTPCGAKKRAFKHQGSTYVAFSSNGITQVIEVSDDGESLLRTVATYKGVSVALEQAINRVLDEEARSHYHKESN